MTVLVTGGTVRLGLAISERLRKDGWRVITSSHRADAGADIVADLSSPMGAAYLYAEFLRMTGGIPPDALVNNAAIFDNRNNIDEETSKRIETVNLISPQKLTMLMGGRETECGDVVNIVDSAALEGGEEGGVYLKSKRALLEYTHRAAAMYAGVLRVNAVCPGPVMPPPGFSEKAPPTPFGRPSAEDVANAVSFLLSAKATTSCVIPVDGGALLEA